MRSVLTLGPTTVMEGGDDDSNNNNNHHHHHIRGCHSSSHPEAVVTNTSSSSGCHPPWKMTAQQNGVVVPCLRSGRVLRTLVGTVGVTLFDPLYIEALDENDSDSNNENDSDDHNENEEMEHNDWLSSWNQRSTTTTTCYTGGMAGNDTRFTASCPKRTPRPANRATTTATPETRDVVDSYPHRQSRRHLHSMSRIETEGQRSLEEEKAEADDDDDDEDAQDGGGEHDMEQENDTDDDEDNNDDDDHLIPSTFLEPEHSFDLQECPRILNESSLAELRQALPDSLRYNKWERCFAIGRDGDSMISMLQRTAPYVYTILVGLDTHGHVVGGFCTESWSSTTTSTTSSSSSLSWLDASSTGASPPLLSQQQHNHQYHRAQQRGGYYGTGQSFLFASHPDIVPGLDAPRDPNKHFMIYKWTGDNDYCQIIKDSGNLGGSCRSSSARHRGGDHLAMGGKGDFGLIVHDHFVSGETGRCATFGNPPLVPSGHFDMVAFEVYGAVSLFSSSTISPSPSSLSSNADGGGSCPVLEGSVRNSSSRHSNANSRTTSQSTSSLRSPIRLL